MKVKEKQNKTETDNKHRLLLMLKPNTMCFPYLFKFWHNISWQNTLKRQ